MFFEGDVFNNTSNARVPLLKTGAFNLYPTYCAGGGVYSVAFADGSTVDSVNGVSLQTLCNDPLSVAGPAFIQLQQQFQAAARANPLSANSSYVGNNLTINNVYGAPYRTPYSEQWNAGIQRELFKGAILSADYVHNSSLKVGQQVDQNHVGAARYLNVAAAQNAIATTTAASGCSGGYSQAAITCAIAAGANLASFAGNGLDSGNQYLGGNPAGYVNNGLTVATGAAFGGANPLLGNGNFILPIGRSGYDALQVVYKQVTTHPAPGIESMNVQVSYSLSRVVSSSASSNSADQFFSGLSWDNDNPNQYIGYNGLDRTHQLSMGGSILMKYGPVIGLIGHFSSSLPTSLTLDNQSPTGGIFQTDLTGDGTAGDLAPGTGPGDYMRRYKGKSLPGYINNFNNTQAGRVTPAGQALMNAGLMTGAQLNAIGAVVQPIATPAQAFTQNNPTFRSLDMNFSYPIRLNRIREGLSLEPVIAFYNIANLANYSNDNSGILENTTSAGGSVNSDGGYVSGLDTYSTLNANRVQRGSGTFDQGGPRTTEFQLKLNF